MTNKRKLGAGRTDSGKIAAFAAAAAAAAAVVATVQAGNRVVERYLMRPAAGDDAFFESFAQRMPGTEGLEFAETRFRNRESIAQGRRALDAATEVERVSIPSAKPTEAVTAYLYRLALDGKRWAVLAHGWRETHADMDGIAAYYCARGYNVLSVDLRSHGESDGTYVSLGAQEAADLRLWVEYLLVRFGDDCEVVLHGRSLGATAALIAAGEGLPAQVKALISDSAYTRAIDAVGRMAAFEGSPKAAVSYAVLPIMRLRSGYDLAASDALSAVRCHSVPTLFIHGGTDAVVLPTMAVELYTATAAPVRDLRVIPGAGYRAAFTHDPDAYFGFVDGFLAQVDEAEAAR